MIGLTGLLAASVNTQGQPNEDVTQPARAAPPSIAGEPGVLKTRHDVYGALLHEFGLGEEQRKRLRYLLDVPNLVIDGVRRQIALGVYKSREQAEAGLRFTLDDASREIERMLTAEQFSRLKPLIEQAPTRSYLRGVSAAIAIAGGDLGDDEYMWLVRMITQECAQEKIRPTVGWVATFAERKEVEIYLEKRKKVFAVIVEQAKAFLTDLQVSALARTEQIQVDHAFDTWEKFRFRFPGAGR